jgi:protein-L-isoaspartate(D-aspartate) O-methyltransferase
MSARPLEHLAFPAGLHQTSRGFLTTTLDRRVFGTAMQGASMSDFERARRHMVDGQVRTAGVTDFAVIEAMLAVPRELFVAEANRAIAYLDLQLNVTPQRRLMTPMTVGRLLQAAGLGAGRSVLVVGCATGYTAALAAHIGCDVVATEPDSVLAAQARANLGHAGISSVTVIEAPPANGYPSRAPYDVILLDGATEREPTALYEQLRVDGDLVGVFALAAQPQARRVTKSAEGVGYRPLFDAVAPVLPGLERVPSFQF